MSKLTEVKKAMTARLAEKGVELTGEKGEELFIFNATAKKVCLAYLTTWADGRPRYVVYGWYPYTGAFAVLSDLAPKTSKQEEEKATRGVFINSARFMNSARVASTARVASSAKGKMASPKKATTTTSPEKTTVKTPRWGVENGTVLKLGSPAKNWKIEWHNQTGYGVISKTGIRGIITPNGDWKARD